MTEIIPLPSGVELRNQQLKLRIEAWGPNSLRLRATLMEEMERSDWALLNPGDSNVEVDISGKAASVIHGEIKCIVQLLQEGVSATPWNISYHKSSTGEELTAEKHRVLKHWRWLYLKPIGGDNYQVEARFKAYDGERIYGLGQHQHGRLDNKGCVIELLQRNTEVSIPFMYSSREYGFLWNNPAVGRVELGYNGTNWVADRSRQLDYWITSGDSPAKVMKQYADATGYPLMMPKYATGFWQSKLRYRTRDELMRVAREYKRRGLPLSVIVADFFHWTLMGEWRFDHEKWPDVPGMVRELAEMGVKLAVSIWPTVNQLSVNFEEMKTKGYLIGSERGDESHTHSSWIISRRLHCTCITMTPPTH